MAKRKKYIVRVTVVTSEGTTKKTVREWMQDALARQVERGKGGVDSAKASTVDEQ